MTEACNARQVENYRVAFNQGCDDRLAGRAHADCPYRGNLGRMRVYWFMGYRDVDRYWGREASWPVRRLPQVHPEGTP